MPGIGVLSGEVWHDADFDRTTDARERHSLEGWIVELLATASPCSRSSPTRAGLPDRPASLPNDVNGDQYALRFRAPGRRNDQQRRARPGRVDWFTNGLQTISDIVVTSGSNLLGLDLPIDPNGVVYDSIRRTPVAGVIRDDC